MREITRIITPCRCEMCTYCEFDGNPPAQIIEKETVCGDCERKDKLIEQMREALQEVMVLCDAVPTRAHDMAKDYHLQEIGRIVNVKGLYHVVKAALSAAERGE